MAKRIIMCEMPLMGPKLRQLTNMLGQACPKNRSYIKISIRDDDNRLCTVEYDGRATVPTREILDWLELDKKEEE